MLQQFAQLHTSNNQNFLVIPILPNTPMAITITPLAPSNANLNNNGQILNIGIFNDSSPFNQIAPSYINQSNTQEIINYQQQNFNMLLCNGQCNGEYNYSPFSQILIIQD